MNATRYLANAAAGLTLALLAGCGGGGGGGSSALPALVYTGNTSAATATNTNASRLTANVIGSDDAAALISILGVSAEGGNAVPSQVIGTVELSRRLSRDFRDIAARAKAGASTQQVVRGALVPVNEMVFCDVGSMTLTGEIDNVTFQGTVSVTFSSCMLDGITLNGQATMQIDAVAFVPLPPPDDVVFTNITISFGRITLRAAAISLDSGGSMHVLTDLNMNTETIFANLVNLDNNAGRMTKSENMVITNLYSPSVVTPVSFTSRITGRVYDSVYGFVDVTTPVPLNFANTTQLFPDGGQMLLTDGVAHTIRVVPVNVTLVDLQLDLDGVPGVDNTARLKWTDLTRPIGADLGDKDVPIPDGMHNSWETFYGLDPNVDDAAGDKDNDGQTNIQEYMAGTDPSVL